MDDTVFRPRRRLLAHYRDLLVDDLFTDLRDFTPSPPATSGPSTATPAIPSAVQE
ncbi:hypothetical protein ACGFIW_23630 [Micromonospora sp. NPDC048935]|uniref:hypothetical protein n=1 Tax=Micromonospora sp. NPDC048935 TaxID=3364262 RepID=UPI00371BE077